MNKNTVSLPWSPEELRNLRAERLEQWGEWDEWYSRLPTDLKRKLAIHDFKRLGDLFKEVFKV